MRTVDEILTFLDTNVPPGGESQLTWNGRGALKLLKEEIAPELRIDLKDPSLDWEERSRNLDLIRRTRRFDVPDRPDTVVEKIISPGRIAVNLKKYGERKPVGIIDNGSVSI